jgi:hypothetical protein
MVDKRIDELTSGTAAAADLIPFWDASAAATKQAQLQNVVPYGAYHLSTGTHSSPGVLSVARQGRAQRRDVTVSANITGWTDNLTDGDTLQLFLLGNGGSTDYTAVLSALDTEDGGNVGTLNIYPDSEIEIIISKRGANLWATTRTWAAGAASVSFVQGGAVADGGAYTATKAITLPSSGLVNGDMLVVVSNEVMASGDYTDPAPATSTDATQVASFGTQITPRARPQVTVFTEPLTTADHSGTVTIDFSAGGQGRSSLVWGIWRSSSGSLAVEAGPTSTENASSNEDVNWASVSTLTAGAHLVAALGHRDATGLSSGALGTFTEAAVNTGAGRQSGMWYKEIASPGSDAPATVSGLDEWVTVLLAVAPA